MASLLITGTLTECDGAQPPTCEKVVYQRVRRGLGNAGQVGAYDLQRRAHVIPADPMTAPQLARRSLFATAVAAWQALAPAERLAWRDIGAPRGLPGYHAFLSSFLRST